MPWPIGSWGRHEGHFNRDPPPIFPAGGHCGQFCHGHGCIDKFILCRDKSIQKIMVPTEGPMLSSMSHLPWFAYIPLGFSIWLPHTTLNCHCVTGVLTGEMHDDLRLIPAFWWMQCASYDCSWYLLWSMNVCDYLFRRFCLESSSFSSAAML